MKLIYFPQNEGQKYYESHYRFFYRLAEAAGVTVQYCPDKRNGRGFEVRTSSKIFHVDFGDHNEVAADVSKFDACFRYHFRMDEHSHLAKTYPLTPISFYNWSKYHELRNQIRYSAWTETILNNQKPGKAALERRGKVQYMLRDKYGARVDTDITDKETFWKKANRCLISVCVPGARNNILDRGQFQYWAFGACTISPKLDIVLPYWIEPEPGIHYISCQPDYADLIDRIEWCRDHRDICRQIGANAQELFLSCCTPNKVWSWIEKCLGG